MTKSGSEKGTLNPKHVHTFQKRTLTGVYTNGRTTSSIGVLNSLRETNLSLCSYFDASNFTGVNVSETTIFSNVGSSMNRTITFKLSTIKHTSDDLVDFLGLANILGFVSDIVHCEHYFRSDLSESVKHSSWSKVNGSRAPGSSNGRSGKDSHQSVISVWNESADSVTWSDSKVSKGSSSAVDVFAKGIECVFSDWLVDAWKIVLNWTHAWVVTHSHSKQQHR